MVRVDHHCLLVVSYNQMGFLIWRASMGPYHSRVDMEKWKDSVMFQKPEPSSIGGRQSGTGNWQKIVLTATVSNSETKSLWESYWEKWLWSLELSNPIKWDRIGGVSTVEGMLRYSALFLDARCNASSGDKRLAAQLDPLVGPPVLRQSLTALGHHQEPDDALDFILKHGKEEQASEQEAQDVSDKLSLFIRETPLTDHLVSRDPMGVPETMLVRLKNDEVDGWMMKDHNPDYAWFAALYNLHLEDEKWEVCYTRPMDDLEFTRSLMLLKGGLYVESSS